MIIRITCVTDALILFFVFLYLLYISWLPERFIPSVVKKKRNRERIREKNQETIRKKRREKEPVMRKNIFLFSKLYPNYIKIISKLYTYIY